VSLASDVRKLAKDVAELTKLVMNIRGSGGGGGEANTASNVGVGGVGLYNSKVGVDLQFKNINAGSAMITVTNDVPNKEVDINLGPHTHQAAGSGGQLDHGLAMTAASLLDDDHTGYLLASGARALAGNWALGGFNLTGGGSIYSDYYILGANPASAGRIRLPNNATIRARNAANLADITLIYADANDRILLGGGEISVTVGGNVVIGASAPGSEKLEVRGRLALLETTDPVATANYGKIWADSADSLLYYMNDSGVIFELTAAGTVTSANFIKYPWLRHPGGMMVGNLAFNGIFGVDIGVTAPGAGSWQWAADGRWFQKLSNAIAGNTCQVRATNWTAVQPRLNPHAWWLLKTYTEISHVRLGVGMGNTVEVRGANPNQDEIRFRFSTVDGDANWQVQFRAAAGTTTINTGVAVALSTVYFFQLWTSDAGVTWNWDINGTSGSNILNVPLTTQFMSPQFTWIPESAVADAFLAGFMYWEYDQG
jgi:hypothetical protein